MRSFELHPVRFSDGQTLEEEAIGALLIYDDGFEFEWDEPEQMEALEQRLSDLLEEEHFELAPHPDPTIKARVRYPIDVGSEAWVERIADLLEGPRFRLRLREND